jgi:hypothetical protein
MMNQETIMVELQKWMIEFVEQPNSKLDNWAPCPYSRTARINNSIKICFSEVSNLWTTIKESLPFLEEKDVIIICFDHAVISATELQEFVESANQTLMMENYIILEDHPEAPEYINSIKMNFDHCGLIILQKLNKLNEATKQLKKAGYYDNWSTDNLKFTVDWRDLL